jgi:hypothetical protein
MRRRTPLVLAITMTFALASCGSEGAVKSTPTPPIPPAPSATSTVAPGSIPKPATHPSDADFKTPEYMASNASVASNAIGAWQMGATGKGITIGFVDTGLVPIRTDFAGKIHPDSSDVIGSRSMDDTWGHGTAVAGIAAGAKDDRGMHGVAFDATIFMAKADQGCPDRCMFTAEATARGIDAARIAGAKVINLSIGGSAAPEVEDAARRAATEGIILVVGSGNSGAAPSAFAQRLAKVAPNNVIIVGALGTATSEADAISYDFQSVHSAPASSSRENYLGAPGLYNAATYFRSDGIDKLSGSSFAAPVVSGALALLAQAFPTLSAESLIKILYISADDLGIQGVDDVFGQGRLNIGRAFQPIGSVRMAGTGLPVLANDTIVAPAATGDAVYRHKLNAVVLDSFGRAFPHNLASATVGSKGSSPLASVLTGGQRNSVIDIDRMRFSVLLKNNLLPTSTLPGADALSRTSSSARIAASSAVARVSPRTSIAFGYNMSGVSLRERMATTNQSISLTVPATHQHGLASGEERSVAIAHKWKNLSLAVAGEHGLASTVSGGDKHRPYIVASGALVYEFASDHLKLALSHTKEKKSLLGSDILALFGDSGSSSHYLDAEFSKSLSANLTLSATIRLGQHGTSAGTLRSRAASLELSRTGVVTHNDQLMLHISQPLRVESGKLSQVLPVSWDYYTKTARLGNVGLSMEPSGRELKTEFGYAREFGYGHIIANGYVRMQPDHVTYAHADLGLALRGKLIF